MKVGAPQGDLGAACLGLDLAAAFGGIGERARGGGSGRRAPVLGKALRELLAHLLLQLAPLLTLIHVIGARLVGEKRHEAAAALRRCASLGAINREITAEPLGRVDRALQAEIDDIATSTVAEIRRHARRHGEHRVDRRRRERALLLEIINHSLHFPIVASAIELAVLGGRVGNEIGIARVVEMPRIGQQQEVALSFRRLGIETEGRLAGSRKP